MKTNDIMFIFLVCLFSFLFYDQLPGLNFFLFSVAMVTAFTFRHPPLWRNPLPALAAVLTLVSGFAVFLNSEQHAIPANIISLMLFSAFASPGVVSSVTAVPHTLYSVAASPFSMLGDAARRRRAQSEGLSLIRILAASFIVFLISLLFLVIYRAANPLFAEHTKWIRLDAPFFAWLLFTIVGLILVYAAMFPRRIAMLTIIESSISGTISTADNRPEYRLERNAGAALFIVLNLMLALMIISDIRSLISRDIHLPEGVTHADFVHDAVIMLVFSVVIGAGLIMFLHRKDFSSIAREKHLRLLMGLWIAQTLWILITAAFRNFRYIGDYSLTYSRVTVFICLFVAACGLVLTALKIVRGHSNWHLLKANAWMVVVVFVFTSLFNFDVIITRYNLRAKPLAEVDFIYLLSLSGNIPELIDATKHPDFRVLKSIDFGSDYVLNEFEDKMNRFVERYDDDWRGIDLTRARNAQAISNFRNATWR